MQRGSLSLETSGVCCYDLRFRSDWLELTFTDYTFYYSIVWLLTEIECFCWQSVCRAKKTSKGLSPTIPLIGRELSTLLWCDNDYLICALNVVPCLSLEPSLSTCRPKVLNWFVGQRLYYLQQSEIFYPKLSQNNRAGKSDGHFCIFYFDESMALVFWWHYKLICLASSPN